MKTFIAPSLKEWQHHEVGKRMLIMTAFGAAGRPVALQNTGKTLRAAQPGWDHDDSNVLSTLSGKRTTFLRVIPRAKHEEF